MSTPKLVGLQNRLGGAQRARVVLLLAAVLALESADIATVGAVAGPLKTDLGIDNTQVGLLVTLVGLVAAVGALPIGRVVDHANRVRLMAWAVALWSLASLVSAASVSFEMLTVTRLSVGLATAAAGPVVTSLIGDLFLPAERGRIWGEILAGQLLGSGFGFLVSGNLAGVFSWRVAFVVLSLPGFVLAVALRRLLPEPARGGASRLPALLPVHPAGRVPDGLPGRLPDGVPRSAPGRAGPDPVEDDDPVLVALAQAHLEVDPASVPHIDPRKLSTWEAVRTVLHLRTNVVLILASGIGYFFFAGVETFGVEYMRGRFGLGQSLASSLTVLLGAGSVIGVLVSGRVSDRMLRHGRLAARPLVGGLCFLASAVLFVPALLLPGLLLAAPFLVLAAVAYGATNPPLDAARLDVVPSGLWGRAEALRTFLRSLLTALAPLTFGYVSSLFGGTTGGLGGVVDGDTVQVGTRGTGLTAAQGLQGSFLVMLVVLVVAGLLLVVLGVRTYPGDVATVAAQEQT